MKKKFSSRFDIFILIYIFIVQIIIYYSYTLAMQNMELLILRLLHIFCGAFWTGGTIYLVMFVLPAVKALGPDGSKFMGQLMKTKKLPVFMTIVGVVNILTGLRLLMVLSCNFQPEWFGTHFGIAISIGMVAALGAFSIGSMVSRPTANKMNAIVAAVAAAGGLPNEEQAAQLGALRAKMVKSITIMAWHLAAALIFMSIAKYL
jgi:uncharacterized membrane protein